MDILVHNSHINGYPCAQFTIESVSYLSLLARAASRTKSGFRSSSATKRLSTAMARLNQWEADKSTKDYSRQTSSYVEAYPHPERLLEQQSSWETQHPASLRRDRPVALRE